ncbi:hypothetical protein [Streptomyces sp. B8F3]|uniref:hypothetical protein n=1 Tax=unclassified Streptomyces TaxID=2593676 RepID=UPI00325D5697
MTGTRKGDEAVARPAGGSGDREGENTGAAAGGGTGPGSGTGGDTPDGRGAAAEPGPPGAGEPARTESSGVLAPADPAAEAKGSPATTDPVATAEPVAADPVAIADPVAPAPATPAAAAAGSAADDDRETGGPLMVPSERDEWGDRLHRATGRFVDDPPGAVDDACVVLGDLGERIAALLAERRDACRDLTRSARAAEGAANAETERLRLALRDSRDLAERLLTS